MRRAAGGQLFEDHMKFVRTLAIDLKADQTTMILLLVISLFSPDRPNLTNKELVSTEQERYSELLCKYLESRYPYPIAHAMYPKLLMKLTDIRNLNEEHSQVLLKVNPDAIQPLMQEVLDLRDLRNQAHQAEVQAQAVRAQVALTQSPVSTQTPTPMDDDGRSSCGSSGVGGMGSGKTTPSPGHTPTPGSLPPGTPPTIMGGLPQQGMTQQQPGNQQQIPLPHHQPQS